MPMQALFEKYFLIGEVDESKLDLVHRRLEECRIESAEWSGRIVQIGVWRGCKSWRLKD